MLLSYALKASTHSEPCWSSGNLATTTYLLHPFTTETRDSQKHSLAGILPPRNASLEGTCRGLKPLPKCFFYLMSKTRLFKVYYLQNLQEPALAKLDASIITGLLLYDSSRTAESITAKQLCRKSMSWNLSQVDWTIQRMSDHDIHMGILRIRWWTKQPVRSTWIVRCILPKN